MGWYLETGTRRSLPNLRSRGTRHGANPRSFTPSGLVLAINGSCLKFRSRYRVPKPPRGSIRVPKEGDVGVPGKCALGMSHPQSSENARQSNSSLGRPKVFPRTPRTTQRQREKYFASLRALQPPPRRRTNLEKPASTLESEPSLV